MVYSNPAATCHHCLWKFCEERGCFELLLTLYFVSWVSEFVIEEKTVAVSDIYFSLNFFPLWMFFLSFFHYSHVLPAFLHFGCSRRRMTPPNYPCSPSYACACVNVTLQLKKIGKAHVLRHRRAGRRADGSWTTQIKMLKCLTPTPIIGSCLGPKEWK